MPSLHQFKLDNGLRCIVSRRSATAMATVNILYDVGARDETRQLTGLAHLFEHLMFGGSIHVPSFDKVLEVAGGRSNAWTSNDFTNFYDTLPAADIATALYLESDRMMGLKLTEQSLAVQKAVVTEEFKQTHLNRPYGDAGHKIRAMLYDESHPYSWPTIGLTPEHVAAVTIDDARQWFDSHYAPNNAVLSIVAPQPEDEIEEMVRLWFSDLPRREVPPRHLPDPGFPKVDVRQTVTDAKTPQPYIIIAYPMTAFGTLEYYAADMLTDILSAGRAGRCWRNLVQGPIQGLFADADASISGSEHEGMLLLTAMLSANADDAAIAKAAELLEGELCALATPGSIRQRDLERARNNYEASYTFDGVSARSLAFRNTLDVIHGQQTDTELSIRRALTTEDLAATAAAIIARPKATLIYKTVG